MSEMSAEERAEFDLLCSVPDMSRRKAHFIVDEIGSSPACNIHQEWILTTTEPDKVTCKACRKVMERDA